MRRLLHAVLAMAALGALTATLYPLAVAPWRRADAHALRLVEESQALSTRGQREAAQAKLEEAFRLSPDNLEAHRERGMVLLAWGRAEEGAAELRRVAEAEPQDPGAAWEYAFALSAAKRPADAVAWFARVTALEPSNGPAYAMLAASDLQLGRKEEAMRLARRGVQFSPRVPLTQFTLGITRWEGGDAEGGRAALEALRLQPSDRKTLLALLTLSRQLRHADLAEGYIQQALAISPNDITLWVTLGQVRLAERKLSPAATAFRRALQHDPTNTAARKGLKAAGG